MTQKIRAIFHLQSYMYFLPDQCVSDHVNGKKHRHLVNLKVTREEQAEKSVFVGNLQKTTSELELTDYFSQYGPLSKVVIDKQKVCNSLEIHTVQYM